MKTLFDNARLIDPATGQVSAGWLLIENGTIAARTSAPGKARRSASALPTPFCRLMTCASGA